MAVSKQTENDDYKIEFRSIHESQRIDDGKNVMVVSGLNGLKFIVKPYQRGYRWQASDVEKLIDDLFKYCSSKMREHDLRDFISDASSTATMENSDNFDFYCLQTLTVKKLDSQFDYELIDGQQRLTTMLIFYKLLNISAFSAEERDEELPYDIVYARNNKEGEDICLSQILEAIIPKNCNNTTLRKWAVKSYPDPLPKKASPNLINRWEWMEKYLEMISENIKSMDYRGSVSIDIHYIQECIETCVRKLLENNKDFIEFLYTVVCKNTFFIWYEVNENPYDTFVNLNNNQIKLTNAELIKSLILKDYVCNKRTVKIYSIVPERWENIEQELGNNELWAFISGENKATRIDLILEIFARTAEKAKNLYEDKTENEWALFDWYEKNIGIDISSISPEKAMKDFENIFDRINEWYGDVEIYHYIGLITKYRALGLIDLNQEELITQIYNDYNESKNRESFIGKLKERIKTAITLNLSNIDSAEDIFTELSYDSEGSSQNQRRNIQAVLWLINAMEVIYASENKGADLINSRLPFNKVMNSKWSLEHIMPQNPESADEKTGYASLMNEVVKSGADVLKDERDKQLIWNLTLLEQSDNSSGSNENLSSKRENLIKRIGEGSFVPGSTVNVFLLYYNAKEEYQSAELDMKYWTKKDAENYKKTIIECLEKIGF